MPIQKEEKHFIQFRYEPSYLEGYAHLQSNPVEVLMENGWKVQEHSDINLDGGNVVKWEDKVIVTTRVFEENPHMEPDTILKELSRLFEAEVFTIPSINTDMTGHADGHLRFVNKDTVLVNEMKEEYAYWKKGFDKMIKESKLKFETLPMFFDKDPDYPESAIGIYVNYLQIGNLIIFPIFQVDGNKDVEALGKMMTLFPDSEYLIEPVQVNNIAKRGGLLNCISWNILNNDVYQLNSPQP
jgi:agmatine deiminase